MKIRSLMNAALFGQLMLQAGCDAKAGDSYQGEPLLSFHGSVRLESTTLEGPLMPALAFMPEDGVVDILDVDVHGSFPANFNLDVLQPPPEAAMTSATTFVFSAPRLQRLAIGYITAVPAQHKTTLRVVTYTSYHYTCEGVTVPSTMPLTLDTPKDYVLRYDLEQLMQEQRGWHRGQPGQTCIEEISGSVGDTPDDPRDDYQQVSHCDYTFEHCEVDSSSGDPEIARSPWKKIAGLSTNYEVLYLPEAVEAGTPVSRAFGGGALTMGYHLLEVVPLREQDVQPYFDCVSQVSSVELYNAAHGTHFADESEVFMGALPMPEPPDFTNDPKWWASYQQLEQELRDLLASSAATRCAELQPVFARPVDPAQASISVEISAHVTPQRDPRAFNF